MRFDKSPLVKTPAVFRSGEGSGRCRQCRGCTGQCASSDGLRQATQGLRHDL